MKHIIHDQPCNCATNIGDNWGDDHHQHRHGVTNSGDNWGDGEGTGRSEKVPRGNSTHLASIVHTCYDEDGDQKDF